MNLEVKVYDKRVDRILAGPVKSKIIRYFSEVNMRNGHEGLAALAAQKNVHVNALARGEYVVFVNKKQSSLKMFAAGNVVAHLKMPGSGRINPKTILLLPKFFNGSEIDYTGALREVLTKEFKGWTLPQ